MRTPSLIRRGLMRIALATGLVALSAQSSFVITGLASPQAGVASSPSAPVTLTLRLIGGRHQFRPGERIPFELSFESPISGRFVVAGATSDRSGRLTIDEFHVTPVDGISDPMLDLIAATGGFMGGGISGIGRLGEKPYVVALELNDWFRFDAPGTYEFSVRSRRVTEDTPTRTESGLVTGTVVPVESNTVSFEILPRDDAWAATEFASAMQTIAPSARPASRVGCRTLRFLGTHAAIAAMVRHLENQRWGCGFDFTIGLYSAPDRADVVQQLEAGLRASDVTIGSAYLRTLAALSIYLEHPELLPPKVPEPVGRQAPGPLARRPDLIEAAQARYRDVLMAALPAKTGPARAATLVELWESTLSRPPDAAPVAGAAAIRQQLIASFADVPTDRQQRTLEYLWRGLAHPDLLPVLQRLADGSDALADIALRRLYELDPVDGRARILRAIQNPSPSASLRTLGLLPDRDIPELDEAMVRNVEGNHQNDIRFSGSGTLGAGGGEPIWESAPSDIRFWLLYRYSSPAVAPRLLGNFANRVGLLDCRLQSYLLAYLLRASPDDGVALLNQALAARQRTGCYQSVLSDVAALYMVPAVEAAALAHLRDENATVVRSAVETLGGHGLTAAERPLREHFGRWHGEWKGRQDDLRFSFVQDRPHAGEANVEAAYLRALGKGQAWLMGPAEVAELRSLCVTDGCRASAHAMATDASRRTIRVSGLDGPAGPGLAVAQYSPASMDALKQKLAQFAKGTSFALDVAALYPEARAPVIADLRAFADAQGIEVVP